METQNKTLYTNGCSWTWGGALEDYWTIEDERLKLVWPYHLSKLLNVDKVTNQSLACGSNQRVMRTTFDWVLSKSEDELKNTIAVIQWSQPSRYEYYIPKNKYNRYESIHNRWISNIIHHAVDSFGISPNYDYGASAFTMDNPIEKSERVSVMRSDQLYNHDRMSRYTDIEGLYNSIAYMESLSSLFKRYGVNYYFWSYTNDVNDFVKKSHQFNKLKENYNWLYDMFDYEHLSESSDVSEKNKDDQHPSLKGHKQLAELIYNKIKK